MAQAIERKILDIIRSDDVGEFDSLMQKVPCGKLRLGRFPVLSLMYLYNSHKLISSYESELIKITEWKELKEPAGVSHKFGKAAGKCLRLYFNEVVSPVEMLLVLDKTAKLKKVYPLVKPPETVNERLKSIYYVKYSLKVKFDGGNIIIDRRPLRRGEKKKLFTAVVACVLALSLIIAVPSSVVSYARKHAGDVTAFEQIDFSSKTTYTLKNDIVIPDGFTVRKSNCTIKGDGHEIVFGRRASIGEFGGKMSNLTIFSYGNPIFSACTETAVLEDITVNVNADITTEVNTAFVAVVNYGTIDDVTLNVSGKVYAYGEEKLDEEGNPIASVLSFGGIVSDNYYSGTVKNCTVNFTDFSLEGVKHANASFGGIAGINRGEVRDCTLSGDITSDTFDLGGACYANVGTVSEVKSSVNLTQVSSDEGWYPTVGGIVIQNESTVEYCVNTGNIAVTGNDNAVVGGISATNYDRIYFCASRGDIRVSAPTASVGGVYGESRATAVSNQVLLGTADYSVSYSRISVSLGENPSHIGGIGGLVQQELFTISYVEGNHIVTQNIYLGGGVTNSAFLGSITGDADYTGNIAGVCSENIYSSNSYNIGGDTYSNFAGNYYLSGSFPALGALLTSAEKYVSVTTEKGATPLSESEIKNTETYKLIIKVLGIRL